MLASLLALTYAIGIVPSTVYAKEVNAPSKSTFWTNDQLKALGGTGTHYAYDSTFQKAYYGDKTWYVIGAEGDSLVLLSDSQLGYSRFNDPLDPGVGWFEYNSASDYALSLIYKRLNSSESEYTSFSFNVNNLFRTEAKSHIKPVRVPYRDSTQNIRYANNNYLYLPDNDKIIFPIDDSDPDNKQYQAGFGDIWRNLAERRNIYVGSNNQYKIPIEHWLQNNPEHGVDLQFWLRWALPEYREGEVMVAIIEDGRGHLGGLVGDMGINVDEGDELNFDVVQCFNHVVPAFNLSLSSLLFSSAAPAASADGTSDVPVNGTMTFRFADANKIKSTAKFKGSTVTVTKSEEDTALFLCAQYNDGASDKIYTKEISSSGDVDLSSIGDLSKAKVWLERKGSEGQVVYASLVGAASEPEPKPEPNSPTAASISPKTGDNVSPYALMVLLISSLGVLILARKRA